LIVPSGRGRTRPAILSTYSLRTCSATREDLGAIRVEHHLNQTLAVAQVDEDDPAVVAPALHPAAEDDLLPCMPAVQIPTILRAHRSIAPSCSRWTDPARTGAGTIMKKRERLLVATV
jgi:hypothetical protein